MLPAPCLRITRPNGHGQSDIGSQHRGPTMMSASCYLAFVVFLVDGPASAQLALDKTTGELARGQRLFEAHCARCHGMKGGGGTGANLSRPVLRYADDDQGVFSVVQDGIPGTEMP